MDKLKPCPFCGGGTQDEDGAIDHDESCFVYQLIDMFMYGTGSKKKIEEAWNIRKPMRNIEAYARIAVQEEERTCKNIEYDPPWFTCSECGSVSATEWLSSGSDTPNYCPNCGAKVDSYA